MNDLIIGVIRELLREVKNKLSILYESIGRPNDKRDFGSSAKILKKRTERYIRELMSKKGHHHVSIAGIDALSRNALIECVILGYGHNPSYVKELIKEGGKFLLRLFG